MKLKLFLCTFVLLIGSVATAQTAPTVTILNADKPFDMGEVITLKASPIPKDLGIVDTNYVWRVLDVKTTDGQSFFVSEKSINPLPDGSIFFGSGIVAKKFLVTLDVTFLFEIKQEGKPSTYKILTSSTSATVEVVGNTPVPPPGPEPPPTPVPDPVLPEGKFGLAPASYKWTKSVDATVRVKGAAALVQSFQGVSSAIVAGTLKNPQDILNKAHDSNNAALTQAGITPSTWDAFGVSLQKYLFQLYSDKKLVTPQDYADAFNEIASGLAAVK